MKAALDIHRELLGCGVPHEMIRLLTPAHSADDLPTALEVDPSACVAVRCYVVSDDDGSDRFVAVVVATGQTPDPSALLEALRARRLRAATDDEVNLTTDYAAQLVSPLALPDHIVLLADSAVGAQDVVYAPTGESGVAVGIRTNDLLVATSARVANLGAGLLSHVPPRDLVAVDTPPPDAWGERVPEPRGSGWARAY